MAQLSTRYGRALYELALESGDLDVCLAQALTVRDVLADPKCRRILEHPHISAAEKRTFLQEAFDRGLHAHLTNFMGLLITKNRGEILMSALTVFIDLGNQAKGRTEARVVSAVHLSERQILAIQALLVRKLGKEVALFAEVDPALIGGFSIHVDGNLVDGSVRGRLYALKDSIAKGGETL